MTALKTLLIAAGVAGLPIAAAYAEQPDFTGAWESYRAAGGGARGAAGGTARQGLAPEGQAQVEQ